MDRILVPTDFSKSADAALSYAIDAALAFGSSIHLVHAYTVPSVAIAQSGAIGVAEVMGSIRCAASTKLRLVSQRVEDAGVELDLSLSAQPGHEAIAVAARRSRADLVIMGTRGHSGLTHAILGSTAERTLRIAPCPVLTVSERAEGTAAAARRILVPSDFSPVSAAALQIAGEWAGPQTEIVLLHAHYVRSVVKSRHSQQSAASSLRRDLQARLEKAVLALRPANERVSVLLQEGESESSCILRVAEEGEFDLIVMGTHGRTGIQHAVLGSVAERVVRSAPCPTLTLKVDGPVEAGPV